MTDNIKDTKYLLFSESKESSEKEGYVYAPYMITELSKEERENNEKVERFIQSINDDESLLYAHSILIDRIFYLCHRYCPKCGSRNISETCVGYMPHINGETLLEKAYSYKCVDRNRAICNKCGFKGTVEDLVDEESAKKLENYDK